MSNIVRHKGRFTKQKVVNALERRSENIKKHLEKKKLPICDGVPDVKGNRIINVNHMAKQMVCSGCKEALLLQNIESETINAFGSVFYVRCEKCLLINPVKSGEEYQNPSTNRSLFVTNTKSVLGGY